MKKTTMLLGLTTIGGIGLILGKEICKLIKPDNDRKEKTCYKKEIDDLDEKNAEEHKRIIELIEKMNNNLSKYAVILQAEQKELRLLSNRIQDIEENINTNSNKKEFSLDIASELFDQLFGSVLKSHECKQKSDANQSDEDDEDVDVCVHKCKINDKEYCTYSAGCASCDKYFDYYQSNEDDEDVDVCVHKCKINDKEYCTYSAGCASCDKYFDYYQSNEDDEENQSDEDDEDSTSLSKLAYYDKYLEKVDENQSESDKHNALSIDFDNVDMYVENTFKYSITKLKDGISKDEYMEKLKHKTNTLLLMIKERIESNEEEFNKFKLIKSQRSDELTKYADMASTYYILHIKSIVHSMCTKSPNNQKRDFVRMIKNIIINAAAKHI